MSDTSTVPARLMAVGGADGAELPAPDRLSQVTNGDWNRRWPRR